MSSDIFGKSAYFGRPRVTVTEYPCNVSSSPAPLTVKDEYRNELGEPVTVVMRDGVPITLAPDKLYRNRRFVITRTYIIQGSCINQTARFLSEITDKHPQSLKSLKKAYDLHSKNYTINQPVVFLLEYEISIDTLRKYGRSLYHGELDCLVVAGEPQGLLIHPYSGQGQLHATIWSNEPEGVKDGGAMFVAEIIDNTGEIGDRFLNIANEVYPVRAKRDSRRADGLYLTRTDPTTGDLGSGEIKVNHIPYQNEEGLVDWTIFHLFRTYMEARTLGDLAGDRKLKLAEMEHELQIGRKDLENLRQEGDREKQAFERERQEWAQVQQKHVESIAEREARNKELEAERDRIKHDLDLERMRKKDHYEDRSQNRKDSTEWLKLIPAAILGGVAIAGAILGATK